jgi:hypothetical protein
VSCSRAAAEGQAVRLGQAAKQHKKNVAASLRTIHMTCFHKTRCSSLQNCSSLTFRSIQGLCHACYWHSSLLASPVLSTLQSQPQHVKVLYSRLTKHDLHCAQHSALCMQKTGIVAGGISTHSTCRQQPDDLAEDNSMHKPCY